jgi:Glycosyltransferase family 87
LARAETVNELRLLRDRSRCLLAVVLAAGGFVVSWAVVHHGPYAGARLIDTPIYEHYGDDMRAGLLPYRDFAVEYPPAALPAFLIPSLIAGGGSDLSAYGRAFELLMAVCGASAMGLGALVLARQHVDTPRLIVGVAFAAFTPLLIGSVILSRYDLWPAALTIASLAAIVSARERLAFGLLALAVAAKAYPIVIVPFAVVYVCRRSGRRQAIGCFAIFASVLLACFLPFVILAPHGIWLSIHGQISRPLEIESLGASILLAAHQLTGAHLSLIVSHGSQNLGGHAAGWLASVLSVLQIAALLIVWLQFVRGPATQQRLLVASAAAVCTFVAFGRVLSPQYLIWPAPLVVALPGRRGLAATGLLAAAMGLTQIWIPGLFWQLTRFETVPSWAVLGRDLVLLALLATVAWPDLPIRRSLPIGQRAAETVPTARGL